MKTFQPALTLFLMAAALACPAQQPKLRRELSHVPVPVRKTVRTCLGTAKFESLEKNTDDGEVTYDVEMVRDGKERGFTVNASGQLMDSDVLLAELPPVLLTAIRKQAGADTIGEIDKSFDDGEVSFNVEVTAGSKSRTLTFDPDGELDSVEEKVDFSDTPEAVQKQINSLAAGGHPGDIRKITEDNEISYDVQLIAGADGKIISIGVDGQILPDDDKK